ncbi:MAG: UvrB/UvrC motif-containing protein [Candidatus Yanofskybacteria bacterium]|nr:UvrB/UvrC motif-containing protein [Candidatus Yanofskybacteria bacterium]
MKGFSRAPKEHMSALPKGAGVYAFLKGKELLYIGKASNLRTRVKNHFQRASWRDTLFIDQAETICWKETSSDIDALLLESELIQKHQPRYNVMWKDNKSYLSVAISKDPLPRVSIVHQRQLKEQEETIGPFVDGSALRRALRVLRSAFPYYTQPQRRGAGYTQRTHPRLACPYCHLGLCPGPDPDEKKYRRDIKNLIAVLKGKKTTVLKTLNASMQKAAKNQEYEQAARIRDQIEALERIFAHSFILSRQDRNREEFETPTLSALAQKLKETLGTKKEIRRIEGYDISNIQGNQATGSMVVFQDGNPEKVSYRKFKIKITGHPDDFAMMEELLSRRMKHTEWPYPDLFLIDGGKGQLSSALKAFNGAKLRLTKTHIAALAKQQNEIFLPGRATSILLSSVSPEIRNLLMRVRDEAHRFAISYHRKLMSKRENTL